MFVEIITNKVIIVPVCSWALAQLLKVIIVLIRKKQLDFRLFVVSGGMPSAHSATVTSLATSVALVEGYDSVAFGIALIFALIVLYDAAGLRQSVGKQSIVLNRVLRELRLHRPVVELGRDLREFIGHTEFEVLVGGLLGIVVAWSWFTITAIS
ncbi:divergent PAP2 family protein [Chloroflexota bacterium]